MTKIIMYARDGKTLIETGHPTISFFTTITEVQGGGRAELGLELRAKKSGADPDHVMYLTQATLKQLLRDLDAMDKLLDAEKRRG